MEFQSHSQTRLATFSGRPSYRSRLSNNICQNLIGLYFRYRRSFKQQISDPKNENNI